ncbi:Nucleotidyltransferase domain [Geoglobus ahangari]|uniref:Nucleotidyltransferase domain n=1 Tax=Geoglobus ahangari TaxID=113653 RepID=A0A0F7IH42_9EURY|nr:nucleotidyltransferase domain-containing protein [Geoglobus ahangari]AKG92628.1 Nucleotidyltransferase domain [Geoglobus ahangari]
MGFLKKVYERRRRYFENLEEYLKNVKEVVQSDAPESEIYIFGSVVRGDYSIGLSDIDVAIVSDRFSDREKKLEKFGKLTKEFFDSPFEFHVLTREQWEYYRKFVREFRKV